MFDYFLKGTKQQKSLRENPFWRVEKVLASFCFGIRDMPKIILSIKEIKIQILVFILKNS